MEEKSSRSGLWIVLGLAVGVVLIVVVAGCAGTAATGAAATAIVSETTEEDAPTATAESPPTEPPATQPPATAQIQPAPAGAGSGEIMTEDNRSERLKALTKSWNTDWTRHTIRYEEILSGGPPRDGIPSVDNPKFVSFDEASVWLADNEPVIALEIEGDARAYPLQILTWHEITNDVVAGIPVAVTFCPLCNSAITFDRRFDGQVLEFGTSGLLRNSDLVMYDRTTESLWQQFTGEGIVGELAGEMLDFIPSSIISFADFRAAYPEGMVMSRDTGFSRRYGSNPYVGYDNINQSPFLFDGIPDDRLPPMARVITVSLPDADVAYPLTTLAELGVIHDQQGGQDLVVFHLPGTASALDGRSIATSRDVGASGVFDPNLNGQKLTFKRQDKVFVDDQTGSSWNIVGYAIDGSLAGEQLTPILHADHFWFSWAAFRPDTVIYTSE